MVDAQIMEKMKQLFFEDFESFIRVIRQIELNELDVVPGIEAAYYLSQDIADDLKVLGDGPYQRFITQRNELSRANIVAKKVRIAGMKKPKDDLDIRSQKRTILMDYDLPKYQKLASILKSIAFDEGWFA